MQPAIGWVTLAVNPIPTNGGFLFTVSDLAGANCGRGGNNDNNGSSNSSGNNGGSGKSAANGNECSEHKALQAEGVTASYSGTANLRIAAARNVPEPASLALMVAAIGAASLARRRSVRTAIAPVPAASRDRRF